MQVRFSRGIVIAVLAVSLGGIAGVSACSRTGGLAAQTMAGATYDAASEGGGSVSPGSLAPGAGRSPAAVTDLRVTGAVTGSGSVTVTLGWTPPAGAFTTTLRYDHSPIGEDTWAGAQLLADDLPGSTDTHTAEVPYSGGTLYFALKTQDGAGDWSAVSNNATWSFQYRCYLPLVLKGWRGPGAQGPQLEGCEVYPGDHIWNVPVDALPVDPNSAAYIDTIGADTGLHPDFGSGTWEGSPIGIPFTTVPGTQPPVSVTFDYDDESDPGPYPIPPDAPIEGGSDRHVLVLDRDSCILYEMWNSWPQPDGSWHAGSGAVFNLSSYALRPDGWTSADAAGLPILPGLVRYDEVAAGEIRHAIRFTANQTNGDYYVWPARHKASSLSGPQYPPMGQRFRLKAGFDISGFSPEVQVILQAMKTYGIILADNGSDWYISGVPDERWDNDVLHELDEVYGSDFEAVDVSSLMVDPNSGQAQP